MGLHYTNVSLPGGKLTTGASTIPMLWDMGRGSAHAPTLHVVYHQPSKRGALAVSGSCYWQSERELIPKTAGPYNITAGCQDHS